MSNGKGDKIINILVSVIFFFLIHFIIIQNVQSILMFMSKIMKYNLGLLNKGHPEFFTQNLFRAILARLA